MVLHRPHYLLRWMLFDQVSFQDQFGGDAWDLCRSCNSAANPLCFIDVPRSVFRAVTITTAFELLAGAGNVSLVAGLSGVPCIAGLAKAVGDEG